MLHQNHAEKEMQTPPTNNQDTAPSYGLCTSHHLDADNHARLIEESHERSIALGIDPNQTCAPSTHKLTPAQLQQRIQDNQPFYDLVTTQLSMLFAVLKGSGFSMAVADSEGYILETLGDPHLLMHYENGNCKPGYRWTELDVGTCAIGLVLRHGIPIQLSGKEMFCTRAHHITNSAAPVYDDTGTLLGVIVLSGFASEVHIHTLGMIILAAKAIRSQLGELSKAREVSIKNTYMNALMESDQRGVLALNTNGDIVQCNRKACALLGLEQSLFAGHADGSTQMNLPNIAALTRTKMNWKRVLHSQQNFREREVTFLRGSSHFPLVCSLDPLTMPDGENAGGMLQVMEHDRMLQLANAMAGSQARFTFRSILGNSPKLNEAKKVALAAARGDAAVLLYGETGTGKELFAQAIHNASPRSSKPFVVINCGAIPNELLESELFGYVEGAFTGARKGGRPGKFELADGGTLFLDEIGDMPLDMQVKILRALQSGEVNRVGDMQPIKVDLRIIAATNVDLDTAIKSGTFREDLFYRISTLNITIPPLRARGNDVIKLAETFLARIRPRLGKPDLQFSSPARIALSQANWPGNIRQLENAVERAVNICEYKTILPEDLGLSNEDPPSASPCASHPLTPDFSQLNAGIVETEAEGGALLGEMEQVLIERLMVETNRNISKVARILGVSRPTLYRKLKKYSLL